MKKSSKIITVFTLLVVFSSIFIGCSKQKEAVSKDTIVVWANFTESQVSDFKKVAAEWSKENSTPVVIYTTESDGSDYLNKDKNSRPDIILGASAEETEMYVKAESVEKVPEKIFPKDQYVSNDLVQATSLNGVQYGVPLTQDTVVLYYNKDLVNKVPQTMEELLQDAKSKGFCFASADYYFSFGIVASQGGYIFKNNNGIFDKNDIGLNNEGAVKGYEFLQDMFKNDKNLVPGATDMYASNKFSSGKVAYYIGEAGRIRTFNNDGTVDFGLATIPTVNGKEVTPLKYVKMGVVSSSSTKKEKAWSLLKAITESSDEILMDKGPSAPVYSKSLQSDTYKNSKYAITLLEQCNKSMLLSNIIQDKAMDIAMPSNFANLVLGKTTPEKCGQKMEKDMKKAIKEILTY